MLSVISTNVDSAGYVCVMLGIVETVTRYMKCSVHHIMSYNHERPWGI